MFVSVWSGKCSWVYDGACVCEYMIGHVFASVWPAMCSSVTLLKWHILRYINITAVDDNHSVCICVVSQASAQSGCRRMVSVSVTNTFKRRSVMVDHFRCDAKDWAPAGQGAPQWSGVGSPTFRTNVWCMFKLGSDTEPHFTPCHLHEERRGCDVNRY